MACSRMSPVVGTKPDALNSAWQSARESRWHSVGLAQGPVRWGHLIEARNQTVSGSNATSHAVSVKHEREATGIARSIGHYQFDGVEHIPAGIGSRLEHRCQP
jgi:hypothetical protein